MKRTGRSRRKTRSKLRKNVKDRGRINIGDYLKEYKEGDMVVLRAEPAVQKGMYFPRFHGRHGVILGKKGECYEVRIKDINKEKIVIVHPVHLKAA